MAKTPAKKPKAKKPTAPVGANNPCFDCTDKASGTLSDCEDGGYREIPPAAFAAFAISDPNRPAGPGLEWVRPAFVPVGMAQELATVLEPHFDPSVLIAAMDPGDYAQLITGLLAHATPAQYAQFVAGLIASPGLQQLAAALAPILKNLIPCH